VSRLELIRRRPRSFVDWIRSHWTGPLTSSSPEFNRRWGYAPVSSGVSVSEHTALNYSAVWSAIQLVAGDVASLPLMLYRRTNGGKERYDAHPLYRILHDAPNPEMTAFTFRETVQSHIMAWGNGYAEIERDAGGRMKYLWPLTPDRVSIERDGVALRYRVSNPGRQDEFVTPPDMLHIPGLGFDGVCGYSVIAKARESIGLGVASERFGGTFYGNGAQFGGVFSTDKTLTPLQEKNWRESMNQKHQGVDKAHQFLLVQNGMTYTAMGVPPNDAQFLETRQFQVTEIARWFGVPPHKIGDLSKATFSNIEQQNIEYFQTTLVRWLERWEQALMMKLIPPLERNLQLIEFVTDGILRGDSQGRAALETAHFNVGAITPNEIRAFDNRNPYTGGDRPFVPLNMIPLDRVDEWIDAQINEKKAPKTPPPSPGPPDDGRAVDRITSEVTRLSEANGRLEERTRQAEQKAEDLSGALAQIQQQLEEARAAHAAAIEQRDSARAATLDEQTRAARAQADAQSQIDRLIATGDEQQASIGTLTVQVNEATATVRARETERDLERARAEIAETDVATKMAECAAMLTSLGAAEHARSEAEQARQAAAVMQAEAEAERDAALQRAEQSGRDEAVAVQAQQAATALAEQTTQREAKRLVDVMAAHRAIVVDTMARLITKETDRARRHQATPQKLRSWMDAFYEGHRETCSAALLPIVRAQLAWSQSDTDPLTAAATLADEHVDESMRQLRDLLVVDDFPAMLEGTLARWEQRRPEALADRLMSEGVEYVRRHSA
jgi:HK97 family phage portal protein